MEFPSPSSDLKVPIGIGQLGTRFSGRCHCREVYTRVNIWTVRRGKKVAVVERWPSVSVKYYIDHNQKDIHHNSVETECNYRDFRDYIMAGILLEITLFK